MTYKYREDAPLRTAPPETKKMLITLAEIHADDSRRPCCDDQTTLADWREAGLWPNDDGSVMIAYALLLVMPVVFLATLAGAALSVVTS